MINTDHLRSIFLYACEQVPAECWSSKLGGCVFYLLDKLISHVDEGYLPCYFIKENNLIDHLRPEEIREILEKLNNLRGVPLQHLMSFKLAINEQEAMTILQTVREDMDSNFIVHLNVRKSVLECFVPLSIDIARVCIQKKNFKKALEQVQSSYEDRLTVATCEDALPFVAFLSEVVSAIDFTLQWWFLLFADEQLGTAASSEISMKSDPVAINELLPNEAAKDYGYTMIPSRLAVYPCTFCYDFAFYLFAKYRTTQAITCLEACIGRYQEILHQRQLPSGQTSQDQAAAEQDPRITDFSDKNMLKVFLLLFTCCNRLKKFDVIYAYMQQIEDVCARRGTKEAYFHLSLIWKTLGYEEEATRALSQYQHLPSGDEDVIEDVNRAVFCQTPTY